MVVNQECQILAGEATLLYHFLNTTTVFCLRAKVAPEDLFDKAKFFFRKGANELKATEGKEISQGTKENKAVYKSL